MRPSTEIAAGEAATVGDVRSCPVRLAEQARRAKGDPARGPVALKNKVLDIA
jgi:hypothetical protein